MRQIRRAAVIGSGVMGAQIAAHLANVGIPSLLLDLVPQQLTPEEEKGGLSLDHPAVRNRLATEAIRRLQKLSPAPLFRADYAKLITPGNLEDDLHRIAEVDWVIEVIVESLEPKRELLERIERHWHEGIIVSTNTSGISINAMVEGRGEAFRRHLLGTHFFNPPRYMQLLEVIPAATPIRPSWSSFVIRDRPPWQRRRDRQGHAELHRQPHRHVRVVWSRSRRCRTAATRSRRSTPSRARASGRPKSATFRTLDLVGHRHVRARGAQRATERVGSGRAAGF